MKEHDDASDSNQRDEHEAARDRTFRALGRTAEDDIATSIETTVGRISIMHGGNAEVMWCRENGEPAVSLYSFAASLNERPVAGDWVGLRDGLIVRVLKRRSALRRTDPYQRDVQTLAANIDLVLLVIPVDNGLNVRLLERFAVMAWESGAQPVVVLAKSDSALDLPNLTTETELVVPGVNVLVTSSLTGEGLSELRALLHEGVTAVMLGASGAGKTSLLNALEGRNEATGALGRGGEGRHVTSTRKLYQLSSGGVLLDIPGIRLVDLVVDQVGVDETFSDIKAIAEHCRFRDCRHQGDQGCAVEAAVRSGELAASRLENWRLIQLEMARQIDLRDPNADPRRRRRKPNPPDRTTP